MIMLAMLASIMVVNAEATYNILSIDGGGIRGILPAGILLKIEGYAYKYAKEKGYEVPEYTDPATGKVRESVHLKDMFDMMAGTSTGSILAAGLAYPDPKDKDKPKDKQMPFYFMKELMDIYTKEGNKIFVSYDHSFMKAFFIVVLFASSCGALGYYHGKYRYDNDDIKEAMELVKSNARKRTNLKGTLGGN